MANRARNIPGSEPELRREVVREEDPMEKLDYFIDIYQAHKKNINNIASVIIILAVGIFVYFKMYKEPNDEKAATALSYPQMFFQADSLNMAMNGDGKHKGFDKLAKQFEGTPSGNLSNFYQGVIYLRSGDFPKAIKSLQNFDGKGTMLSYQAWGALGEAYMESGNKAKAIEYLKKATGNKEDAVLTPLYLYHLGLAYTANNNTKDAIEAYKKIRDDYPKSMQAKDIDKELAMLGEVE